MITLVAVRDSGPSGERIVTMPRAFRSPLQRGIGVR